MPRPRMPPTPSSSTDIVAKENALTTEMESVFALPPPALQSAGSQAKSKAAAQLAQKQQTSPPLSPENKKVGSALQRKRTLSGSAKSKSGSLAASHPTQNVDGTLPPPPSRARKIIQMKPKQPLSSNTTAEEQTPLSSRPASSHKETSTTLNSKRKQAQPSTTSAAGRKIARKTAHSIIERRRRSKMNEEFGVLKDMIPACAGVEMHKLAILQAGIEYVRYLESCIEQLKDQHEKPRSRRSTPHADGVIDNRDDDESMDTEDDYHHDRSRLTTCSGAASESEASSPSISRRLPPPQPEQPLPSFRRSSISTSATNSAFPSPDLRPIQSGTTFSAPSNQPPPHSHLRHPASMATSKYSVSPPPGSAQTPMQTGVSPAFGAFHFSPDLARSSTWSMVNGPGMQNKPSPHILPLPQSALPLPLPQASALSGTTTAYSSLHDNEVGERQAEATATAALLMMTKDRRDTSRSGTSKGISVKDLLSS